MINLLHLQEDGKEVDSLTVNRLRCDNLMIKLSFYGAVKSVTVQ